MGIDMKIHPRLTGLLAIPISLLVYIIGKELNIDIEILLYISFVIFMIVSLPIYYHLDKIYYSNDKKKAEEEKKLKEQQKVESKVINTNDEQH